MSRYILVLLPPSGVVVSVVWNWRLGLAFLVGGVAGLVNFHWLKRGVAALVERMVQAETHQSSRGIVASFVLRYALLAAVAYAIFRSSDASLYAFLAGLFLPVAAMMMEAAYEGWVALRRGL